MDSIETIFSNKIKEADPTLDVLGADRKVLQVAFQDFNSYVKFHWNFVGNETNQCELEGKLDKLFKEDPAELDAFLTVWTGIWFKKWKERVNLLIGKQDQNKLSTTLQTNPKAESMWTNLECKEEMIGIVTSALIKNAEVCGTRIIAENLLKAEIQKNFVGEIKNKEQLLIILNNALHKARETAQRAGPIISIKIDKSYYCQLKSKESCTVKN
jgi:hypothetical protein